MHRVVRGIDGDCPLARGSTVAAAAACSSFGRVDAAGPVGLGPAVEGEGSPTLTPSLASPPSPASSSSSAELVRSTPSSRELHANATSAIVHNATNSRARRATMLRSSPICSSPTLSPASERTSAEQSARREIARSVHQPRRTRVSATHVANDSAGRLHSCERSVRTHAYVTTRAAWLKIARRERSSTVVTLTGHLSSASGSTRARNFSRTGRA
jgi:hypothetical protein